MLHILFLILKTIGIVIGIAAGIVLLLLLVVLLVPVRYEIRADSQPEFTLKVHVHYLLQLLGVRFEQTKDGNRFDLRILWFHPFKKGKESSEKEESSKEGAPEESFAEMKTRENAPPDGKDKGEVPDEPDSDKKKADAPAAPEKPGDKKKQPAVQPAAHQKDVQKDCKGDRKDEQKMEKEQKAPVEEPVRNKAQRKVDDRSGVFGRLAKLKEKKEQILEYIQKEENIRSKELILDVLKKLLFHILPRSLRGDITFAMQDPAATGMATGVVSLCPAAYEKGMHICPDFTSDRMYFEGTVSAKGRIRCGTVFVQIIRLALDENIRTQVLKLRRKKA
jgi:hypothetical protein